jgi:hypothetical protein
MKDRKKNERKQKGKTKSLPSRFHNYFSQISIQIWLKKKKDEEKTE